MSNHHDTEKREETEESNDPQLTELVAYLDGELDDSESSRLERQLASDPPLRKYAETLDRTWQLLDNLEEPTASREFTRKTLASISTISVESDSTHASSPTKWLKAFCTQHLTHVALWTTVGFAACSAGLLAARATVDQNKNAADMEILRQLDLLENYPKIYPITDTEFLKQLSDLNRSLPPGERKQ